MKPRHNNGGIRKLCDHPRRQWASCPHSWLLNYKPRGGKWSRFSLDKYADKHIASKSEAMELAGDVRKLIRAGTFGKQQPVTAMTLRQLMDVYLDRYIKSERRTPAHSVQAYRWVLNTIAATVIPHPTGGSTPLGDWCLSDIVTDTILRYREVRQAKG